MAPNGATKAKAKIADLIASEYDYVVRYQGGNNAGHTVIHGDKKLALHLMPSGVMYENAIPVIGNGVVVDPGVLVKEMAMLEAEGISCKNLKISCDAHVIMPYHKDLDGADEKILGDHRDRHHQARHRPVLPGQGGSQGHPHPGPHGRERSSA